MSSLCGDDSVNTLIEEIGMGTMTKAGNHHEVHMQADT